MEESKLPFVEHFYKLRTQPKWLIKLISLFIIGIISGFVAYKNIPMDSITKIEGVSSDQQQSIYMMSTIVGGAFGTVLSAIVVFVIFLIMSKILKSDVGALSLFSAAFSYSIIIAIYGLIVNLITLIAGINPLDTRIDSLNIFSKGNVLLSTINLEVILKALLTGIVYFATSRLSKRTSIILAIVALILLIITGMTGSSMSQGMQGMAN
ncbi:YIP1 family protein [Staphylococcus simiae]|uniref:YIP1 family protein n=1 Tax=Staphylococcus simiae TaxID=308354 RepID=UPI001A9565C3|nr:YIP1 family protein [Staphylococcus simiae]MBO1198231.1 YIP1 family protein [Staphylococcus simiae]MBO1200934.1 YIP1 family protein [Staphylococcus simiae]MBO1203105.1 YIP1 family protein [Staphylococcus simiae]MBO1210223.1 YIP1 family protein [Staphylococcus simiae]MBO1229272.1 YIP1 family protein [Staphylococcus simiae]